VEELQEVDVVLLLPEMLLQEEVDGTFKQKGVVDRNVTDSGLRCQNQYLRLEDSTPYSRLDTSMAALVE
jgi:hypothetical protein